MTGPEAGADRASRQHPRRRKTWNEEAVIEGVALALDELGPAQRLTQRTLDDRARGRSDIPGGSILGRVGLGLEDAKRKAEALRRACGFASELA